MELIEHSLADMNHRGGLYGPVQMAIALVQCLDRPVCALVTAAYQVSAWAIPEPAHARTEVRRGTGGREGSDGVVVSVESAISSETAHELNKLYRASFTELEQHAAARQLLDAEDALDELADPRIDKYVVRDEDGAAIGLTTMTTDLDAGPLDQPCLLQVEISRPSCPWFVALPGLHPDTTGPATTTRVPSDDRRDHGTGGPPARVVAWDMCCLRQEQGLRLGIDAMLKSKADVDTVVLDEQAYVASLFHGAHGHMGDPIRMVQRSPGGSAVGASVV